MVLLAGKRTSESIVPRLTFPLKRATGHLHLTVLWDHGWDGHFGMEMDPCPSDKKNINTFQDMNYCPVVFV